MAVALPDIEKSTQNMREMLAVGAKLYSCHSRQDMLDTVLKQARDLTRAQAGSLYLTQGKNLRFVAVQNDVLGASEIGQHLLGHEMPISTASLAGFVALSGQVMNIPDSFSLPSGSPFHINRDFDAKTGYRVQSILAFPLSCPDGECIGILELFNCIRNGDPGAFPTQIGPAVMSLASTAAITVHNMFLQEQLRQVHLNTIFRLSTIAEYRDTDTGNHVQRVSRTSELLANALGLKAEQVDLIKCASPMHDVGKVAIPDAILLKPGDLTARQRKVMERHTVVGAAIFDNPEDPIIAMARDVALYHHERWDGQGYPNELVGESIPLPGRIVGLADVFDAVVSRRCYKAACPLDVALDILDKDSGKHFDPAVVKAFLSILDKILESYPSLKAA